MATRSRTSFQKRQKEIARAEKQRDKAARRQQKKLGGPGDTSDIDDLQPFDGPPPLDENGEPVLTPSVSGGNAAPGAGGQE